MLKWIIFGRGFDSPRLHQPSFATKWRRKTATANPSTATRPPGCIESSLRTSPGRASDLCFLFRGEKNSPFAYAKTIVSV